MENNCEGNEIRQKENIHPNLSPQFPVKFYSRSTYSGIPIFRNCQWLEPKFVTLSTGPSPQPSNVILPQICLSHCPWFFKPILVFLGGSAENPDSTCTHWPHSELGPTKSILKYISEFARVERNLPPAKIPKILPRYSLSWVFNSWRDKKVSSFWLNKLSLFLSVVKFTGCLHCFSGNLQYCSSV